MNAQPEYVSFDPRGREELLSQIGSFSPAERTLFQRLCESWAPRINAERFIKSTESSEEQERTALRRLMAKLRSAGLGVLTTTTSDSGSEPDEIILTTKDSLEYWVAVVEEAIRRLLHTGYRILPSEDRIREAKALPPDYHVADTDSSQLVAAYSGDVDPTTVHRIRLMGNFRILFTPGTTKELILRSLSVLKTDLEERGIIEELARVRDSSISEVRKHLESKAPDVWLDLTKALVKERSTIAFRKNIDEQDEIFQLAYLVMSFVDAQIGAARERQEHEQVIDEELDSLANQVRDAASGTLSQEEFSNKVEECQTRLARQAGLFAKRLTETLLTPRPHRKLPRILYIHGLYIHRDRVCSVFQGARAQMSERLTREYTELMEAFLRGRNPDVGELFGSRQLFNEDIARRVERQHPLLGELIARPQVVAEAVIHDARQRREGISSEEMREVLGSYFDIESSALKPLNELLSLNLVQIFDDAFARIGVLRQLFLRISGRYESLRANYIRRFGPRSASRPAYPDEGEGDTNVPEPHAAETEGSQDLAGVRVRGGSDRPRRVERTRPGRHRTAPRQAGRKAKSPNEIERIWKDFDKALRSKPSEKDSS